MKNKLPTILVVDDTETNIDILIELLDEEYDILVALEGQTALDILKEETVDLILLDIMMPGMDGFETAKYIKENKKTQSVPIIFITAKTDEDSIEKAYDIGGIDYVTKPFKPKELLARVKTQLRLKQLIENLEFISSRDSMTGIYNRRKFFELSSALFKDEPSNIYALMIDLDNFKSINDNYGHDVGDQVIKSATATVSKHISEDSIFGRLGGEEFAVVCKISDENFLNQQIERMMKEIRELRVITEDSKTINFTMSIGIAKYHSDMQNIDQLLKVADNALYEAKGSGRNKSIFRS